MTRDTKHNDRGFSPTELAGASLRTFFNIARVWCLTQEETMRILGINHPSLLDSWMEGRVAEVGLETLERVSTVLGIFEAINTLLPVPKRADAWLRAANAALPFDGRSALDRMADGRLEDLSAVRQYLDSQTG